LSLLLLPHGHIHAIGFLFSVAGNSAFRKIIYGVVDYKGMFGSKVLAAKENSIAKKPTVGKAAAKRMVGKADQTAKAIRARKTGKCAR
jgi:hypothetical protein